jgi:hypothetical protein
MISICATPKAFKGDIKRIQENAIKSWLEVRDAEIILFGNEEGVGEMAKKYKVRHIPDITLNYNGVPYLDYIFQRINEEAKGEVICYVSADVMLFLNKFSFKISSPFLGVGYRYDYDNKKFEYGDIIDRKDLVKHNPSGCDYWIFPKGMYKKFPRFTIGRGGQEGWMIWHGMKYGVKVIDFSNVIKAIHQNHDYSHIGKHWAKTDEFIENIRLAGGFWHMRTLRDIDYILDNEGNIKDSPMDLYFLLLANPIGQWLLGLKRWINRQDFSAINNSNIFFKN